MMAPEVAESGSAGHSDAAACQLIPAPPENLLLTSCASGVTPAQHSTGAPSS